jgi:hypothetical protein
MTGYQRTVECWMKKNILLVLCLVLPGCATQSVYKQTLDDWVGHDVDELISTWGNPHGTYQDEQGDTVYWYLSERTLALPPATSSGGGLGGSSALVKFSCNTWFWLDSDNRIARWQVNGNYCDEAFVAKSLQPVLRPAPVNK